LFKVIIIISEESYSKKIQYQKRKSVNYFTSYNEAEDSMP